MMPNITTETKKGNGAVFSIATNVLQVYVVVI